MFERRDSLAAGHVCSSAKSTTITFISVTSGIGMLANIVVCAEKIVPSSCSCRSIPRRLQLVSAQAHNECIDRQLTTLSLRLPFRHVAFAKNQSKSFQRGQ